jgi:MFS family permease
MRWSILVACCLASSATLVAPPLWVFDPPGVQPFDAGWADFRLIASINGVLLIFFVLIGGVVGDLDGRRRVWLIGLSGFVVTNLLLMVSSNPDWHIVLRFLVLAFGSLFTPLALATLNVTFTDTRRAMAFAVYVSINAGAMQIGWLQGQFLFDWLGWRATYVLPVLFGLFATRWVYHFVSETPAGEQRRPDLLVHSGWTLLILAMIYGITVLPVASDRWWMVVGAACLVGVIGAALIFWWDVRTPGNLLQRRSFRARHLTALLVTGAMINFLLVGFGMRTLGLFQVVRSMSALLAFVALAPILFGLIAALYLFLKAMRQYRARVVIAGGLLMMAVAIGGAALLPMNASYLLFVLPLFLFGIGYLIASTVWTSVFLRTVVARNYGVNAAISNATSSIGMAIGSALTGNLLARLGLEIYLQLLTEANVNAHKALEALVGFKTLVLSEPADTTLVTEYYGFALMDGYREAYAIAYSQILWVMVAFCIVTALIVGFGLRGSLQATTLPPTEEELSMVS